MLFMFFDYLILDTFREEIFVRRKFREYWSNLRKKIPLWNPENVNSQKLIPVKFSEIGYLENDFPQKFSKINEMQIYEFLSDTMSFELGLLRKY